MSRTVIYYRTEPDRDRWIPGDRWIRPVVRRVVRGPPRPGGLGKVFINACLGLDRLGVPYRTNIPFADLKEDDRIAVLGRGRYALQGYDRPNPVVAGIGLMTHPSEWPTLCEDYPVVRYLQHSEWTNAIYQRYYGERCAIWPVGIDTQAWVPAASGKDLDVLLYDKVQWNRPAAVPALLQPVRAGLERRGLKFAELRYGGYDEPDFRSLLARSRAMIFLSESESQGIAYQECLASGVPVFAWDQGWWLDPNRFRWGDPAVPATSVPYFDARCGARFRDIEAFEESFDAFFGKVLRSEYDPRAYILEHLTVELCSQRLLGLLPPAQA